MGDVGEKKGEDGAGQVRKRVGNGCPCACEPEDILVSMKSFLTAFLSQLGIQVTRNLHYDLAMAVQNEN